MKKTITAAQLAFLCATKDYVSAKNISPFNWTSEHQKLLGDKPPRGEDLAEAKGNIQASKKAKEFEPAQRIFELRTKNGKSGIFESGHDTCWNSCDKNVIVDPAAYNALFEISFDLTEKEVWALENLIRK